ncbi:hypothetical protein BB561_004915 [Smittium simulii]|uniref:PHD-type domain-containing protein n=1 Tax=Smittium simulii TaxID=133385 RepID=A0A2T9YDD3_9FUNG|nr:hypothetical protein BB561_004915 [Smittium simulii]
MSLQKSPDFQLSENFSPDATLTASEYISIQENLEKEAAEILPGRFDICTKEKGYIHQNVYACLTCSIIGEPPILEQSPVLSSFDAANINDDFISKILDEAISKTRDLHTLDTIQENPLVENSSTVEKNQFWNPRIDKNILKPADPSTPPLNFIPHGFCYGCSISCHSQHDVIELFAKRDFMCDCGTISSKNNISNQCNLTKNDSNAFNSRNSKNLYNHNFWGYYCRCDTFYDPISEPREMIQCFICNDWFHDECIGNIPDETDYENYICRDCVKKSPVIFGIHINENDAPTPTNNIKQDEDIQNINHKTSINENDTSTPNNTCKTVYIDSKITSPIEYDIFAKDDWLKDICKCEKCVQDLAKNKMLFLYKDVDIYEPEVDETKDESLYQAGIKELSKIDRVKAIEGSTAYQNFYQDIKSFLLPFAHTKRTVESKDIKEFFEEINTKKIKNAK